ncbi:MAG: NAD(P)-dependent oxidoreductase [Candidatus Tectomicrobia bacterium]|uniref:NAD(P)-dependent oxidoreductase n=1 Tax=Tectimicrobiota bacterium TaxID=2528274 RepID=A0A932M270_UNCTE|nr:NAD(P)-dependent oxidoreductase [Candidatus Tectomicrobia bacterium]
MNILITGAGLIGCHGARRLLDGGHRVVLFDVSPDNGYIQDIIGEAKSLTVDAGDLRDLPALITVIQKHEIDAVVHTAGLIGKKVSEHPYTGFTVNVQGSVHVAEAVSLLKVRRLVFLSSFGAYNWEVPAKAPVTEDFPLGGAGLYGATKAANEHLLGAFADLYGFDLIILRPAGVFGRGHYRGGSTVGIVMNDLVAGAVRGDSVRVQETQMGTNEYVYVKDVAQAIEKACTVSSVKSRAFNVGTGVLASAQEIVQKVCGLVPGARVELVPPGAGEKVIRRSQPLDLSRSRVELGYKPGYSLESALTDYVQELKAHL